VGVILAAAALATSASGAEAVPYGLSSVGASLSSYQAGAHADFTTNFVLNTEEAGAAGAKTRAVTVNLPPGLIGNPQGFPRCTAGQLGIAPETSECPMDSQVGSTSITIGLGAGSPATIPSEPIYNLVPPSTAVARLGFFAEEYPVIIDVTVDPRNYSLIASIRGSSGAIELIEADTTLWGVPAAPSHDTQRITPEEWSARRPAVHLARSSVYDQPHELWFCLDRRHYD
jgi:hypothetical protein